MVSTEHPDRPPHDSVVAATSESGVANPSALTADQLSRLLVASGSKSATAKVIRRHIEAGAPTAADGRLNLVHYVAWVAREVANADDEK